MQVQVRNFADGLDLFVPGAKFGQTFQVDVEPGAKVKDVLTRLGIPLNVFGLLVDGRHATPETPCSPNSRIDLLEAINGG